MTLPEHAICSLMIAELGVQPRMGWRGVLVVVTAGIAPDLDTASKLFGDEHFWKLHHALGHSMLSVLAIAAVAATAGRIALKLNPFMILFMWCLVATFVHCLTDSLYWWGVQPFWPFDPYEVRFDVLEYLDLIVLAIWLSGSIWLFRSPMKRLLIAKATLGLFAAYVITRSVLPQPTGILQLLTGGWMYAAPKGTPVLDWW